MVAHGRQSSMLPLYIGLIYIVAPVVLALNYWRGRRDPLYRDRLGERWGYTRARFDEPPVWIHAVSVGEVQASAALVRALQNSHPQRPLLITTGTPTGAQRVRALFGDSLQHAYLPYDSPGAVRRFLDRVRPVTGVVMETEIWPNLFRECRRRGIPLLIASARLSEKSVRRYRWLRSLTRLALKDVNIAAQSATDAERFRLIGADAANVSVLGNLKFDVEVSSDMKARGEVVRREQFGDRPVWIAASTHEGEEEITLRAHERVCQALPSALLLIVPRHPPRFASVRTLIRSRNVPFATRSLQESVRAETRVLLVDTLGELLMFYSAADAAFVGGSLAPIGGHSLLEPAVLGCPILIGPHNFNAPDVAQMLLSRKAAIPVVDADSLAAALVDLLGDADKRDRLRLRAREIVEENKGALGRLLARLEEIMASKSKGSAHVRLNS
jgi:3-deoxy-D-manno-octulosonic-acid transferase